MLKPSDNPPHISPMLPSVSDATGIWWVAHTKSRFEKAFAWDLLRRDIAYFLPLIPQTTISAGKKRRVIMPLFRSYVFFCGDENARHAALATDRLCQVIPVPRQGAFIEEISSVEKLLRSGVPLQPYPHLAVGEHCRVTAGPFRGFEGIVVQHAVQARFVVQVSILGQGTCLEIDGDLLEPVVPAYA